MENQTKVRPGRWSYFLSAGILLAGIASFSLFLFHHVSSLPDLLRQIPAPGESEITLAEPGTYQIFYEHRSVYENRFYETGPLSGLLCSISSKETGEAVPLTATASNMTYSVAGRKGEAIFDFRIDKPGVYKIRTWYKREGGPEIILSVGRGFLPRLLTAIFGGFLLLFGSIVVSTILFVIVYIKRAKAWKGTARLIP